MKHFVVVLKTHFLNIFLLNVSTLYVIAYLVMLLYGYLISAILEIIGYIIWLPMMTICSFTALQTFSRLQLSLAL